MGDFSRCDAIIAQSEGGFVNNLSDPGGATNRGITLGTLEHWRGHPCTIDDIRSLTEAEAEAIRRALYWLPVGGDQLPPGIDLLVYDASINQGPGRAARWLQDAAGVVEDGHVGPATLAAVAAASASTVLQRVYADRLAAYRSAGGWITFGEGWTRRLRSTMATATAWSGGSTA